MATPRSPGAQARTPRGERLPRTAARGCHALRRPAAWHDRPVSPTSRQRLDQQLVERGLVDSRSRAQALVLAGQVRVGDGGAARFDRKAGDLLDTSVEIAVVERDPYVSRGAHKLIAALDAFALDPAGLTALDVGASTGGFTDVLLQRGARRVYALDVGRGQLAERLRADPRVVSMERTNARTLAAGVLPEPVELAVIDVAFISLALVLGPVAALLRPGRRPDRAPGQAPVRGGPGGRPGRRRARPGGPPGRPRTGGRTGSRAGPGRGRGDRLAPARTAGQSRVPARPVHAWGRPAAGPARRPTRSTARLRAIALG